MEDVETDRVERFHADNSGTHYIDSDENDSSIDESDSGDIEKEMESEDEEDDGSSSELKDNATYWVQDAKVATAEMRNEVHERRDVFFAICSEMFKCSQSVFL